MTRLARLVARWDRWYARRVRGDAGPVCDGVDLRRATGGQLGLSGSGYDDRAGARPLDDDERRAFERAERGLRGRLDYRDGEW